MCLDTFGQECGKVMGVFVERGDEGERVGVRVCSGIQVQNLSYLCVHYYFAFQAESLGAPLNRRKDC